MSATKTRVPLERAQVIATELLSLIGSYCDRIEVCGSLRRRAPTVGDLDIIAVPKRVPVAGLFEEIDLAQTMDALNWRLDELCGQQVVRQWRDRQGRPCWGQRLKRFSFGDLDVQIQSVDDECLGLWQVIRTGPSGYSHAFVTPRSSEAAIKRPGRPPAKRPGLLPPGFEIKDGFRLFRAGGFIPTPTEGDVYAALDLPYLEPWERR